MQTGSFSYWATRSVANGITTISDRKTRFSTISVPSKRSSSLKARWWTIQKRPISAKLSPKARYWRHWSPSASARSPSGTFGTSRVSTSSVMAIAMTPSLKATTRANSSSPSPRDWTIPRGR
jgi:hypothetical protein